MPGKIQSGKSTDDFNIDGNSNYSASSFKKGKPFPAWIRKSNSVFSRRLFMQEPGWFNSINSQEQKEQSISGSIDNGFYKGITVYPWVNILQKVYVEPTNRCNLSCRTCVRNIWDESAGDMTLDIFEKVLQGIRDFTPVPDIFFGGFGEPLANAEIFKMIRGASRQGAWTEMITNGILLGKETAEEIVDSGLNILWVSIDGATPEHYMDIRLGDELPHILENLANLRYLRLRTGKKFPKLGIAFVAMKRNLSDLPKVIEIGRNLGIRKYSITNLLPYTEALEKEILYERSLQGKLYRERDLTLPRMDGTKEFFSALCDIPSCSDWTDFHGNSLESGRDACPFILNGTISIRWDGAVSPCLPLLHTHEHFLGGKKRKVRPYLPGSLNHSTLQEVWQNQNHLDFRERVGSFDFSPCTYCGGCELAEDNEEDCFGNTHPTCGGCLWAQGFIRCP